MRDIFAALGPFSMMLSSTFTRMSGVCIVLTRNPADLGLVDQLMPTGNLLFHRQS